MPRKPDLASLQIRARIPPRSPLHDYLTKVAPTLRGRELVALAQRGLVGGGPPSPPVDPEVLARMAAALERVATTQERVAAALERGGLASKAAAAAPTEPTPEADDPRLAALEGRWADNDD